MLSAVSSAVADTGVAPEAIYEDEPSGKRDGRPGLDACLKALRAKDTLIVWKLDRLGRDLRHLVNVGQELAESAEAVFDDTKKPDHPPCPLRVTVAPSPQAACKNGDHHTPGNRAPREPPEREGLT